jgi:hypothetical protein
MTSKHTGDAAAPSTAHSATACLQVVKLFQQLLPKLIHDQLSIAAQPLLAEGVEQASKGAEDKQVAQDDGLDAWPLDLDSHLLTSVTKHCLVHLQ